MSEFQNNLLAFLGSKALYNNEQLIIKLGQLDAIASQKPALGFVMRCEEIGLGLGGATFTTCIGKRGVHAQCDVGDISSKSS